MLPRPDAPARRLPYTTADMSERLAKRKAEQEAAAQAQANQAFRFGVTNPPAVKKDEPWYKDALGAVGGAIKSVYENIPMSNPVSTPVNMGGDAGVSMGGQGTGKSLVTEPLRLAVRRAVGDITAIPRVGEPSPSYTADQIREQGVARGLLGAALDYSNFIPVVAKGAGATADIVNAYKIARMERVANPFARVSVPGSFIDVDALQGSRLPARVVDSPATPATRLAEAQGQRALPAVGQRRIPTSSQLTVEKINVPKGPNTFHDVITIRSFDKTTNKYTGVLTISYDPITKKATVTGMGATNPMVTPQLIAAAATEVRKLVGDVKFPLTPSTDLSASALPFVERLQAAGLIDPNYQLPDTSLLNDISKDYGPLNFAPAVSNNQIVIDPSSYKSTYNNIFKALAETKRASSPATTADMAEQLARALPPAPTAAELARLQREAARAQLGVNIQDIEFPPQNTLITNPELIDPALKGYEQLDPNAWDKLGIAQEKSGFNAQQMPNEMASLRRYFSNDFTIIQDYLSVTSAFDITNNFDKFNFHTRSKIDNVGFNNFKQDMETLVANADRAFSVVPPITKPTVVYRGVNLQNMNDPYNMAFYRNLKPGDLIYDPAFSSTSIDENTARNWAAQFDDAVLIIRLPAGTKVINPIATWQYGVSEMDTHSHAPGEKELLLPRNTTFKVIENQGKWIEVEVVLDNKNSNSINARSGGTELSKTMPFEDAMGLLASDNTKNMIIRNRVDSIRKPTNINAFDFRDNALSLFNNKLTELDYNTKKIFDKLINDTKYFPTEESGYRKLVDSIFTNITSGEINKTDLVKDAIGSDDVALENKKIVAEIEKQEAWMKNNPGKNPRPVFIRKRGEVDNDPIINSQTWDNRFLGVITKGRFHEVNNYYYNDFLTKLAEYKDINPEKKLADVSDLLDTYKKAGVLGRNNIDDLKALFKKYWTAEYPVASSDTYWALEDKFWADLAENDK